MILTNDILTESILDDDGLQAATMKTTDLKSLAGDAVSPQDYGFYVNIRYYYNKLYKETYWWQKWFTARADVMSIYDDIVNVCEVSGLFDGFMADPLVTAYGYTDRRLQHIHVSWEYPQLPSDFDVKAWYEAVEKQYGRNVLMQHEKEFCFYVRIYFNFNREMTHRRFLQRLWKFL